MSDRQCVDRVWCGRVSGALVNGIGAAFYEATLLSSGCMQIGWIEPAFAPTVTVQLHTQIDSQELISVASVCDVL